MSLEWRRTSIATIAAPFHAHARREYADALPLQQPGFVPAPVIGRDAQGDALATADYCARELDVNPGQRLRGLRTLNGWAWCMPEAGEAGWVPLEKVRVVE